LIRPLVAELKALGLYDRTLLILLSDHGEEFYEHGSWMHTNQLYRESLRVPLLIKFPGSGFRGLKSEAAVRLVDVFPTVLETLGLKPAKIFIDGKSLFPILRGRETGDRPAWADVAGNLFDTHNAAKTGVVDGGWKAVWNAPYQREDLEFFSVPPPSRPPIELYELARDPEEKTSVTGLHPDIVRRLAGLRDRFLARSGKSRSVKADLDEDLKAKLRALGYIR
jgi:arylsulfatase A-like enzyme